MKITQVTKKFIPVNYLCLTFIASATNPSQQEGSLLGSQSAPGAQFNQPATAGIGQTSSNMFAAPSSQVAQQPQQEKGKFTHKTLQ